MADVHDVAAIDQEMQDALKELEAVAEPDVYWGIKAICLATQAQSIRLDYVLRDIAKHYGTRRST